MLNITKVLVASKDKVEYKRIKRVLDETKSFQVDYDTSMKLDKGYYDFIIADMDSISSDNEREVYNSLVKEDRKANIVLIANENKKELGWQFNTIPILYKPVIGEKLINCILDILLKEIQEIWDR